MSLLANFYPIDLPFDTFQVSRVAYEPGKLSELRKQHNETHSFFRTGDHIYISPMTEENLNIGEIATLSVQQNIRVVSSLIKHIFFRKFRERFPDIIPLDFYPFRILSRRDEDDILMDLLPDEFKGSLSLKKMLEIQFREIEIEEGNVQFGAVVNLRYRWIFDRSCEHLIGEGFDVQGLQVLLSEQIPGLEDILAPDESLIGTITSYANGTARVETNEGEETHPLHALYLHKSRQNIRRYLEFKLDETRTDRIFGQVRQKDQTRLNAKYYYEETERMAKTIADICFLNKDGFTFSISNQALSPSRSFTIYTPSFIFDYNQGAANSNASAGLINHGPYDSSTFDVKHPTVLVVCHKSNRGGFTEFVGKLKKGIPSSRFFKGGLVGKYRLHDVTFEIIELDNYSIEDYSKKITEYIKRKDTLPDLALVETLENFKMLSPDKNPYYRTKAYFLTQGVPLQFVRNENIRKDDRYLQWICESIALQIYAKLGGRPWVLPASSSIDHEIVVGIGSSSSRSNSLAGNTQERIVGITTFFTGDGRYILGNRCKEVPFEQYFQELLDHLRDSIQEISSEYGWRDDATIRIVFHIFKPIKNIEAEVVDQLLREFQNYEIKYAFVTVSSRHPFLIFDTEQGGIGQYKKGVYVPNRGVNWILDSHSCLLQLSGPADIKSSYHGFSSPVLVRTHEKSTFKDLNSIVQQVYNFSYLSWRGFSPAQFPVTILYSDLIATNLANLRKIGTWRSELVNSVLKHKKWFL